MPGEMANRFVEAKTEEHWPEELDSNPMGRMISAYILNRGGARTIQSHSLRLILSTHCCFCCRFARVTEVARLAIALEQLQNCLGAATLSF